MDRRVQRSPGPDRPDIRASCQVFFSSKKPEFLLRRFFWWATKVHLFYLFIYFWTLNVSHASDHRSLCLFKDVLKVIPRTIKWANSFFLRLNRSGKCHIIVGFSHKMADKMFCCAVIESVWPSASSAGLAKHLRHRKQTARKTVPTPSKLSGIMFPSMEWMHL